MWSLLKKFSYENQYSKTVIGGPHPSSNTDGMIVCIQYRFLYSELGTGSLVTSRDTAISSLFMSQTDLNLWSYSGVSKP